MGGSGQVCVSPEAAVTGGLGQQKCVFSVLEAEV